MSTPAGRWTDCLAAGSPSRRRLPQPLAIGVLHGEGVGPEVIGAALNVLSAVARQSALPLKISHGGQIGREAEQVFATPLTDEVVEFCAGVFAQGGAILHGPGGGRFVYDLRQRFDLFFKISPIRAVHGVAEASRLKQEAFRSVDILLTRENSGGIYQGFWDPDEQTSSGLLARHHFSYHEQQVSRFLDASARLAKQRHSSMTVVWKESGIPTLSRLWQSCAANAAAAHGVHYRMVDIDLMAYRLVHEASKFDVIAASNLFGDVLGDLGAALLGSRGASFSGNYNASGDAVYQTNHGAAFDLAGTDQANPAGQILAVAMMLRESFGLDKEAAAIEDALREVWADRWRTEDVAGPGSRVVGTAEMGGLVAERAAALLESRTPQPAKGGNTEAAAQHST